MLKIMKKNNKLLEKTGGITSSISGTMGFLGSYQVCHNICLGIIALLSLIGITIVGMPLMFLTKVALPFWVVAVVLFVITLGFYFKKKCISKNLLIFNAGIIIAGMPLKTVQNYFLIFWIVGGFLLAISIVLFVRERFTKNVHRRKHK